MKISLNIGSSVSFLFWTLLVASALGAVLFDKTTPKNAAARANLPKIELNNFTLFEIAPNGLALKLSAQNAKQFIENGAKNPTREEFREVVLERNINGAMEVISAPVAVKKDAVIFFDEGARTLRGGYEMESQKATYRIDEKTLTGRGDFRILGNGQNIAGQDIFYDMGAKIIRAENITARLAISDAAKAAKTSPARAPRDLGDSQLLDSPQDSTPTDSTPQDSHPQDSRGAK